MSQLSDEDLFELTAEKVEKNAHGDLRVTLEKDYEGKFWLTVKEVADEDDEELYPLDNGWFTVESIRLDSFCAATNHLIKMYIGEE